MCSEKLKTSIMEMKRKETTCQLKLLSLVGLSLIFFLMTACAPKTMIKPEAFGQKKTLAIVTISGTKNFNAGSKTTKELFTGYDDSNNTQPILDKMKVSVWKALKKSNQFRLASPKQVRNSQAYQTLEADEGVYRVGIFKTEMNTSQDYKYFSDKKKFAKLANDLRVDGVIQVMVNLSTRDTKVYAVGIGAKKTKVLAIVTLIAYDRNGEVFWQDTIQEVSEDGLSKAMILVDTGNINYQKLIPIAEKTAESGINKIVDKLHQKMGTGKIQNQQAKK